MITFYTQRNLSNILVGMKEHFSGYVGYKLVHKVFHAVLAERDLSAIAPKQIPPNLVTSFNNRGHLYAFCSFWPDWVDLGQIPSCVWGWLVGCPAAGGSSVASAGRAELWSRTRGRAAVASRGRAKAQKGLSKSALMSRVCRYPTAQCQSRTQLPFKRWRNTWRRRNGKPSETLRAIYAIAVPYQPGRIHREPGMKSFP